MKFKTSQANYVGMKGLMCNLYISRYVWQGCWTIILCGGRGGQDYISLHKQYRLFFNHPPMGKGGKIFDGEKNTKVAFYHLFWY